MDKVALLKLKKRLLSGGVAYKHVCRFLREIQDHHADLTESDLRQGKELEEAKLNADLQLGQYEMLANEILTKKELQSLGSRYPKTLMLLTPTLTYVMLFVLVIFGLVVVADTYFPETEAGVTEPVGMVGLFLSANNYLVISSVMSVVRFLMMYLLAPALAIFTLMYAIRNQVSLMLAGLGAFFLCLLSCGTVLVFIFPDPAAGVESGQIGASVGYSIREFHGLFDKKVRLLFTLAFVGAVTFAYRRHMLLEKI